MKRLGCGYTNYFNIKYKRSGVLFQGKFKAAHIDSNKYLLHASAYVNLNNRVHKIKNIASKSSWNEYTKTSCTKDSLCKKEIILNQFRNRKEYKSFAENSLQDILNRKQLAKELGDLTWESDSQVS